MSGKTFWKTTLGVAAVFLGYCAFLAAGPDRTIELTREVPSPLDRAEIAYHLDSLSRWDLWHFDCVEVSLASETEPSLVPKGGTKLASRPGQARDFSTGDLIRLTIEPKRKKWKRFFLVAEVLERIPGRKVRLALREDSKGKISRLIENLQWEVELLSPAEASPSQPGVHPRTVIRGVVRAKTRSWRGRLFGGLVSRILLHQVAFTNLQELAVLKPGTPKPDRTGLIPM